MTHAIPGRDQPTRQRPAAPATTPIIDTIASAYKRGMWSLVLRGVISLSIGIYIFARPLASVAAFALVLALWALLDGVANIVRAFTVRRVVHHWWVLLVAGVVSTIFGAAALYYYPALSLAFAVVWTAWWVLTAGVIAVYIATQERRIGVSWGWTMFLGATTIVAGIACFAYPGVTLTLLISLIATFAMLSGALMLVAARRLHNVKEDVKQAAV